MKRGFIRNSAIVLLLVMLTACAGPESTPPSRETKTTYPATDAQTGTDSGSVTISRPDVDTENEKIAMSEDTKNSNDREISADKEYGVFIGVEYDGLPSDISYDVLVIDALYYTSEELYQLHQTNKEIYSYLNVGSLEDFRPYYDQFKDITLSPYENWDGEYWIDVSKEEWQEYIAQQIAPTLARGGVDGFFIDNADIYYMYPTNEIYDGLTTILTTIKKLNRKIIINGGNDYVTRYLEENGTLTPILDGVNQESVFTAINWEDGSFTESTPDDREYFLDYLSQVAADGKAVYVLEYTKDEALAEMAKSKCHELGYKVYVSKNLELNGE